LSIIDPLIEAQGPAVNSRSGQVLSYVRVNRDRARADSDRLAPAKSNVGTGRSWPANGRAGIRTFAEALHTALGGTDLLGDDSAVQRNCQTRNPDGVKTVCD
jgi:hypothetical protein